MPAVADGAEVQVGRGLLGQQDRAAELRRDLGEGPHQERVSVTGCDGVVAGRSRSTPCAGFVAE